MSAENSQNWQKEDVKTDRDAWKSIYPPRLYESRSEVNGSEVGRREDGNFSRRDHQNSSELGGADFFDYDSCDTVRYCDKGNHKESSRYHSPQHARFWEEQEKEQRRRRPEND